MLDLYPGRERESEVIGGDRFILACVKNLYSSVYDIISTLARITTVCMYMYKLLFIVYLVGKVHDSTWSKVDATEVCNVMPNYAKIKLLRDG